MKVGVLFSGGKDSSYALMKAMEKEEVSCLISVISKNRESYMFHTPNIEMTRLQAEAAGFPLIRKVTKGVKEEELGDLKAAVIKAREKFGIGGLVTGAVKSVYQTSRVQKICDDLNLQCLNPLWHKDEEGLLREIVNSGFEVIISGFFAHPFKKEWLGKRIDEEMIGEILKLKERHGISPTGEGGEIETTVLDAPFFKKRIEVADSEILKEDDSGIFAIKKARLVEK